MKNTYKDTHLIDTQEQDTENNQVEQDEFYEETNDDLITEEEIEHIHPDLDHNFPSLLLLLLNRPPCTNIMLLVGRWCPTTCTEATETLDSVN